MAEQFIGKAAELADGDRRIVICGGAEVGIFREAQAFYAYSNICAHQGGPACEGLIIARVEEHILPDGTSRGMRFSATERNFVCPWHGYEYDIRTGECVADRRIALRKYRVEQRGDDLYVLD
jgi:nitrite reductase/ring-hydroxylating ferredoxin subunit